MRSSAAGRLTASTRSGPGCPPRPRFPPACPQCINHGGRDAFASTLIFSPPLTLKWSTYWGGSNADVGYGITMDSPGQAWITGFTDSVNFPVTANCVQCVNGGGQDAIVVRFNFAAPAAFSDY